MLEEIDNAVRVLEIGGIIVYPTDTVWGIGCDASNVSAIQRIYKLKKRNETKSMIILVNDIEMVKEYVKEVPAIAKDLINCFDHPTTIIYPGARNIAKNLIGPDGSIAIRIVKDDFCKQLVTLFGKAIVSTSANISGAETPLLFSKISKDILSSVDYVVNIGHSIIKETKSSTIIKLSPNGNYEVIRQ
jgi:L-threonylcarbamoyladenylate synthase